MSAQTVSERRDAVREYVAKFNGQPYSPPRKCFVDNTEDAARLLAALATAPSVEQVARDLGVTKAWVYRQRRAALRLLKLPRERLMPLHGNRIVTLPNGMTLTWATMAERDVCFADAARSGLTAKQTARLFDVNVRLVQKRLEKQGLRARSLRAPKTDVKLGEMKTTTRNIVRLYSLRENIHMTEALARLIMLGAKAAGLKGKQ